MKFKAIIPILNPLIILKEEEEQEDFICDTFQRMLEELDDEQEYIFYIGKRLVKGNIYIEEKETEELKEKYKIENVFRLRYCLNIDIDIDINIFEEKEFEDEIKEKFDYTEKEILDIRINEIVEELKKTVNDFKIAVNIAFPGFFEIKCGQILVDDKKYSDIETSISSLKDAILTARKKQWPHIEILNIRETWKWLLKREDFIHTIGKKPIERALNAFTYIFDANDYEDLFYSLIGIEAIYASGKQGILEQLREKSSAIFGEPENYKNSLNKMYDTRSRFIHGDLNFPSKYHIYDGIEEFDNFMMKEYIQSLEMAEAILVATIQQFVINDAETLEHHLLVEFE